MTSVLRPYREHQRGERASKENEGATSEYLVDVDFDVCCKGPVFLVLCFVAGVDSLCVGHERRRSCHRQRSCGEVAQVVSRRPQSEVVCGVRGPDRSLLFSGLIGKLCFRDPERVFAVCLLCVYHLCGSHFAIGWRWWFVDALLEGSGAHLTGNGTF